MARLVSRACLAKAQSLSQDYKKLKQGEIRCTIILTQSAMIDLEVPSVCCVKAVELETKGCDGKEKR